MRADEIVDLNTHVIFLRALAKIHVEDESESPTYHTLMAQRLVSQADKIQYEKGASSKDEIREHYAEAAAHLLTAGDKSAK